MRNAEQYETTASWDWAPYEMVIRWKWSERLGYPVGTLFGAGCAKEVLPSTPPPPPAGDVGGSKHHGIGEEEEWRPLLSYANPLGHRIPATSFIARFVRSDMSGDHYEMISKVALGVNRPGGGCTGCVGVNIAERPQWFRKRGGFWSHAPPPPLQGAKMFKGCQGQGLHRGAPMVRLESPTSGARNTSVALAVCYRPLSRNQTPPPPPLATPPPHRGNRHRDKKA